MQAGDEKARLIFEAMAYNVAKTIGSMYAVLSSDIDAIVLTGGLAHSERFCPNVSLKESARWVGSLYIQARMSFWP